jgi:hypothetical protein
MNGNTNKVGQASRLPSERAGASQSFQTLSASLRSAGAGETPARLSKLL